MRIYLITDLSYFKGAYWGFNLSILSVILLNNRLLDKRFLLYLFLGCSKGTWITDVNFEKNDHIIPISRLKQGYLGN